MAALHSSNTERPMACRSPPPPVARCSAATKPDREEKVETGSRWVQTRPASG